MFRVERDGVLYAIGGNVQDIEDGWEFYGDGNAPLQWGTLKAMPGTELKAHRHLVRKRIPEHKTQEFFYVVRGKVTATFCDDQREIVSVVSLSEGSFLCMYDGAHGFKVSDEQKLVMIEVKNGPHVPVEEDKVRL